VQEAVSSVLLGRSQEAEGINRMVLVSLVVHSVVIAGLIFAPRDWFAVSVPTKARPMTVSIQGSAGPETGGMTAMSNRTVTQEDPAARHAVTPPAPKAPELPAPEAVKPKPTPPKPTPKVDKPETARTAKPAVGTQIRKGDARAETGAQAVPFGGLASSAGGMGGVRTEGDFCCPEYLEMMKRAIYTAWNQNQGVAGQVEVKFTIRRDGLLANVEVEKASGNPLLDLESRRAILVTQRLQPLPDRFTRQTLTVYLLFEYKR
jgi:TonB family protein